MSLFEGMTSIDILKDVIGCNESSRFFNWTAAGFKIEIKYVTDPRLAVHEVILYVQKDEASKMIECMKWSIGMERLRTLKTEEIINCAHMVLDRFVKCLETKFPVATRAISEEDEDPLFEKKEAAKDERPNFKRPEKEEYYLNIAKMVSMRSTCLRRHYGAVIVKDDRIVATGYNGAPRGVTNCCDAHRCKREEMKVPAGERYELCCAIHAEANAIMQAGFELTNGATLYLAGTNADGSDNENPECCMMCKRMILNAGIKTVHYRKGNGKSGYISPSTWVRRKEV